MMLSRSSIQEPSASAAIVAWGTLGFVVEAEVLQTLDRREARVDQAPAFAALGALGHLGLEQRAEVGDRRLLLADRFDSERAEAPSDGRELELDRVRLDQRLQRRRLRVLGRGRHRVPPSSWS